MIKPYNFEMHYLIKNVVSSLPTIFLIYLLRSHLPPFTERLHPLYSFHGERLLPSSSLREERIFLLCPLYVKMWFLSRFNAGKKNPTYHLFVFLCSGFYGIKTNNRIHFDNIRRWGLVSMSHLKVTKFQYFGFAVKFFYAFELRHAFIVNLLWITLSYYYCISSCSSNQRGCL